MNLRLRKAVSLALCLFFLALAGCSTPTTPAPVVPNKVVKAKVVKPEIAGKPLDATNMNFYPNPGYPQIYGSSYMLIDARTGRTLAYKNPDRRRAVASTQKVLTAMIVVEAGNLDKPIRIVPSDTYPPPSKMYIKSGQTYTRRQLLTAFLMKSANDAAVALARDNAGSVSGFAWKMNQKARALGAYNSNFKNPHGLTETGQYSTARDMAKIAFHAYRNSVIRDIVRRPYHSLWTKHGTKSLKNTNKLLSRWSMCTGMKTGYTNASGRTLISSAGSVGGPHVIFVQLGSKTSYIFNDARRVMYWGLQRARPPVTSVGG